MVKLHASRNKSFFASFFSKKEESSFSEEKEAKRLLFLRGFTRMAGVTSRASASLADGDVRP
jgi:hypothetical protein